MKEYRIYNTVPAYEKAPVSLELLKEHSGFLWEDINENEADSYYVILPAGESKLKDVLEEKAGELENKQFQLIEAPVKSGFTYQNDSALLKVAEGEKAIPSSKRKSDNVVQIASLKPQKSVYVELPDGKIIKKEVAQTGDFTDLLEELPVKQKVKAVYFGYPLGKLYTAKELEAEIEITTEYIRIIGENQCMLDELIKIAEAYQKETCGRCVFGYEGLAQIYMLLSDIAMKKGKTSDLDLLLDLCQVMKAQTMCEVGTSIAETVIGAITNFREEIEQHITKKTCLTGVCSKFVTYHILANMCVGCMDCIDECEEEAIKGKKRFIHVIDQEECTQCGACVAACDEGAIVKAGAVKPRCPQKPIPCKG